jgi:hypothetical protein
VMWTPRNGGRGHADTAAAAPLDSRQPNRPPPHPWPCRPRSTTQHLYSPSQSGRSHPARNPITRSVDWQRRSGRLQTDLPAQVDGSPVALGSDGSSRIVSMITGMIKRPAGGRAHGRPGKAARLVPSGPILTMDRRPSAVLTRILAGRAAPYVAQLWSHFGSTSGGSALVLAASLRRNVQLQGDAVVRRYRPPVRFRQTGRGDRGG